VNHSAFEQRWRRRFVERGRLMDDDADIAGWSRTGLATRVRQFIQLWDAHPGTPGIWLDIGCGAGTYSRLLHRQGYTVLGIDYSAPSLHKARARSPADIPWVASDIRCLPFPDGYAQGVLCFGVMQALDSTTEALQEMARVLNADGELWVDALNARCLPTQIIEWRRRRRGELPHLRYDTVRGLSATAQAAGLQVVAVEWLPILPARLQRLQWMLETRTTRTLLRRLPWLGAWLSHSFILRARPR